MPTKKQTARPSASIPARDLGAILKKLRVANTTVARAYPGETGDRQPVHTVYGGAHLFKADTAQKMGAVALTTLQEYAPDAATLDRVLALSTRFHPTDA